MAAVDYFLKIDGIDGESVDNKHKGEIEILSYSWGMSQSGAGAAGSGGGSGKVSIQDIHFTAKTSLASPNLMLACATGQHIKKAVITLRKAGGKQEEYLVINLQDCFISSFAPNGEASGNVKVDDRPIESISLNFNKLEWIYDSPVTGQIVDVSFDFTPQTTP